MEYHKIQTLFKRDPETKYKTLLDGEYADPAFEYLRHAQWVFTEKVDGTNIRVSWDGAKIRFGGKTDRAQIPAVLLDRLQDLFSPDSLDTQFPGVGEGCAFILYGEGYGAKIQKGGGNYNPDGVNFVLFDVLCLAADGSSVWLERDAVADIGEALYIQRVPEVGLGPLQAAISAARLGFESHWGSFPAEGLVLRPAVELQDRRGRRIITKIKTKDFRTPPAPAEPKEPRDE